MFSFIKKIFKPSLFKTCKKGDIEAVKQHLAADADVNADSQGGGTPLDGAIGYKHTETADLLRKHGGKISEVIQESLLIFDRNSNILSAAN